MKYPKVRRDSAVADVLFGKNIADPYRWLEDPKSKETQEFVSAQNSLASEFIGKFGDRERLHESLTAAFDYEKYGCPFLRGGSYYFFHNSGLQAQSVLYKSPTLKELSVSTSTVFFDPNSLRADGTASLSMQAFSKSGRLFAYGISYSGSDWVTINIMDSKTGEKLPDAVEWVKFSGITWTHDDKGFYYLQYPKPKVDDAGTETDANTCPTLFYHTLGEPQEKDVSIFADPSNPTHMFGTRITDDGTYLVMTISNSCDPVNKVYIVDLREGKHNFMKIIDNFEASYSYVCNEGSLFTFKTNKNAPKYKVVTFDINDVAQGPKDIIPTKQHVLQDIDCVADKFLVATYMEDCRNTLSVFNTGGEFVKSIEVDIGSLVSMTIRKEDNFMFFKMASFLNPGIIYRYDFDDAGGKISTFIRTKFDIKGCSMDDLEQKQVFYNSSDGARVPMFIVAKKGAVTGDSPAFLYGYGGFNIPLTPMFSPQWLVFMLRFGGVLAIANLRGGGEYGDEWHKAGSLHNKQQCFDDFQYAARYLVAAGYTKPEKVIINGGSNGGLLVAACANQTPELFGCAIAEVGVLDMLRFHKFTIGHAWRSDYGDPDVEKDFDVLIKYSPLHNIAKNKQYPAMLLLTSDHDDRVVPLHSFKYMAELQYQRPDNIKPLLIRIDTKAGHGAGKPTAKRIEECVERLSFIAVNMNLTMI